MKAISIAAIAASLLLASCATVTINPYSYTGEKPLYPAIYEAMKEGKAKFAGNAGTLNIFKDAYISKADIYGNVYTFADMYILDTNTMTAILTLGTGWYPTYLDFNTATKGTDIQFSYENIRLLSNGVWLKQDELPSQGKTGIPTITAFMYDSIRHTMSDGQAYSTARKEALSDPVFLRAILANMTKLLRDEFLSKELSQVTPEFTMEVVDVQKNGDSSNANYKYYVLLAADMSSAQYEVAHSRVYVRYYTNRDDVVSYSKGAPLKFSGHVTGINDSSISSWSLIVQD